MAHFPRFLHYCCKLCVGYGRRATCGAKQPHRTRTNARALTASFPRRRESTAASLVGMDSRLRGNDGNQVHFFLELDLLLGAQYGCGNAAQDDGGYTQPVNQGKFVMK